MELFDGRYEKLELLGRGSFSEVWKVRDSETGVIEALKIYTSPSSQNTEIMRIFTHEFSLMAYANHPNLLRPLHFAVSHPEGYPYLKLKYCNRGSIGQYVGRFNEKEARKLIKDISSALSYLHSQNPPIIHQDIKPENILLDEDNFMLSDFGVSTQVKTALSPSSESGEVTAGTIAYMAPEKFDKGNEPIMANDIYSLGTTVYEMLTGLLPFGNDGGLQQKAGAQIPELPTAFSLVLDKTLKACLNYTPWSRPRASQLVEVANKVMKGEPIPLLPWERTEGGEEPIISKPIDPIPDLAPKPQEQSFPTMAIITAAFAGIGAGVLLAFLF